MVRRISLSQFNSQLREAARKQKQAVDNYNREVRRYNNQARQAVSKFNREVNAYNSRVRTYRQRLQSEMARLTRQPTSTRFVVLRASVQNLNDAYVRLDRRAEAGLDARYNPYLDLSEREAANSVGVMNSLLGGEPVTDEQSAQAEPDEISNELHQISPDLEARWQGAVFSLNPRNPDAARHFCTSSREIINQILELKAPDEIVVASMPQCERTPQGKPSRRSKVRYFLQRKGMLDGALEEFVEQDLQNVVELFQVFNDATHGSAGAFSLQQLARISHR